MKFSHATVAGTFDRLHIGHKQLISYAFSVADKVSVGVTSDTFCVSYKPDQIILPYKTRLRDVKAYINSCGNEDRTRVFSLDNIYGIASSDATLDCIVVTEETLDNAHKINEYRNAHRLPLLAIEVVPLMKDDADTTISSSRIRAGIINREGQLYLHTLQSVSITPQLRTILSKPFDELITADIIKRVGELREKCPLQFITVGDIVSSTFLSSPIKPDVVIIDNKSRRKKLPKPLYAPLSAISNPPGTITSEAQEYIRDSFRTLVTHPTYLVVNGEEDLLTLPALLAAPLHSLIVYGQPDEGVVAIPVTEENKEKAHRLMKHFQQKSV